MPWGESVPVSDLLSMIDGTDNWPEAAQRIRDQLSDPPEADAIALVDAFSYHFPVPDGIEAPFTAFIAYTEGRYPQFLPDVDNERLAQWASLFTNLDHPLVKARLGDLL